MCKYNFGEFFCSLDDVIFMTEAVCKNNVAACVNKACSRFIALRGLGNICLYKNLIVLKAELFLSSFCSIDKVFVVSAVFFVPHDVSIKHEQIIIAATSSESNFFIGLTSRLTA